MKIFKDWMSYQFLSKSLLSLRPFNFFDGEAQVEPISQGGSDNANESSNIHATMPSVNNQVIQSLDFQLPAAGPSSLAIYNHDNISADPLTKIDALQVKFLRLVHRIGYSLDNVVVAQVLYRLQLASLIRAGESKTKQHCLKVDQAISVASELEAARQGHLDFSFKILVLGKTGVGKSATINSFFDQTRVGTDAFQPSTDHIQEVVGTIKGIQVTVIDTPGLSPSCSNQRHNRRILLAVRKFIRRSPPDIVLYFERLDAINRGCNNYPLLKLITDIFSPSIWFNTILVLTHACSDSPEGSDGHPVNYESHVAYVKDTIQHSIHKAVSSSQLETPVLLVENHPMSRRNARCEMVLPNGQAWLSQFLLLCMATKVLGDANSILRFQNTFSLSQASTRVPSLPHLLALLLRPRSLATSSGSDDESLDFSDQDDEDDYDKLPSIRILTNAEFRKLPKAQREEYLDELDYRETLFLKKQRKEFKKHRERGHLDKDISGDADNYDNADHTDMIPLSDMLIPLSFDCDDPSYRYRGLMGNDQWLVRPVLDAQGWDHDVGFDGINVEASLKDNKKYHTSVVGQFNKDKEAFNMQSECLAKYNGHRSHSELVGIDVQAAGKDLARTIRMEMKVKSMPFNTTGATLSVTNFGNMNVVGAKLEDCISIGGRFKLTANTSRVIGGGQVAYGGGIEASLKGKDYPVRYDRVVIGTTLIFFDNERVLGASLQSDFRVGRDAKMSVSANLNNQQKGQICVRCGTSDHLQIALIAVISIIQALMKRRKTVADKDTLQVE